MVTLAKCEAFLSLKRCKSWTKALRFAFTLSYIFLITSYWLLYSISSLSNTMPLASILSTNTVGVTIIKSHLKWFISSLSHSTTSLKVGVGTDVGNTLQKCRVKSLIKGMFSSSSSFLLAIRNIVRTYKAFLFGENSNCNYFCC